MENSFNYACIGHPALKGAFLRGITITLGNTKLLKPFGRLTSYSMDPLDSAEHEVNPPTRDIL